MDGMDLRFDQSLAPQQQTVISHRQIVAVRVLQLPSQELNAVIAREREINPAFEAEERESCHRCGGALDRGSMSCPVCGAALGGTGGADGAYEAAGDYYGGSQLGGQFEDDGTDPMLRVASAAGRAEGLLQMLCTALSDGDAEIAEYLVGSLDHHGYLADNIVEDTADALSCPTERVEHVLDALQHMDPPGLGARGPRECLLLQLRRLRELGDPRPLAEALVDKHLHALAFRHFREVAREVNETPKIVEAEWQFIHDQLHPYPTHGFDPDFGDLAQAAPHVRPDVIIRRAGTGFEAEVVERQRYDLQINREYLWARKNIVEFGANDSDKAHIRGYVEQAHSFISALRQRWDTMQRVSEALIDLQRAFLERGQSALKPLTRADVAKRVQLHESTVSRATDGKFVLLPNGRTVPFDDFFDSSLPVKKALRELIAAENPRRPLSDEQLAQALVKRGFEIARRTIAKYREEEGILPSRLRRGRTTVAVALAVAQPVKELAYAAVR
jgi:RNA polymerase sigma-54 factor